MLEIGQLCKIELDENTIYKIVDIRTKKNNIIIEDTQTYALESFVDVVEVDNPNFKKIDIPIYNINIIDE